MVTETEETLLRSLALILTDSPGATLQEIAKAAGVSRATLYRFAATREQLLEALNQHALKVMLRIMDDAGLETRPPLEALQQLIANHIAEREVCAFMISQFDPHIKRANGTETSAECDIFEQRMDQFFQQGQAAGVFRMNIPARWLTDLFFGFVFTLCESEYRGRIARADMQILFEEMFLHGSHATPER